MAAPRTCAWVALLAIAALIVTAGCTKKKFDPAEFGLTTTTTTETTTTGSEGTSPGLSVTCFYLPDDTTDATRVEIPCTERHNEEQFVLTATSDLDACYRAVAADGITVGTDAFGEPSVDDPRFTGHTFASAGSTVTCTFDLADAVTSPIIGG